MAHTCEFSWGSAITLSAPIFGTVLLVREAGLMFSVVTIFLAGMTRLAAQLQSQRAVSAGVSDLIEVQQAAISPTVTRLLTIDEIKCTVCTLHGAYILSSSGISLWQLSDDGVHSSCVLPNSNLFVGHGIVEARVLKFDSD